MTFPPIIKHLATLVSGATVGNVIILAATPLLTRLYAPEEFGELAIFVSIAGMCGAVLCLRYEQAVFVPKTPRAALLLVTAGLYAVSSLTTLLVFIAGIGLWATDFENLGGWSLMVPVAGAMLAVYNLLSNWAVRQQHVTQVAHTRLNRSIVQVGAQCAAGAGGFGAGGLIFGDVLGRVAGVWALGRLFISACSRHSLRPKRVCVAAHTFRRFPLFAAPGALINVMVMQGAPVVLALSYSAAAAGLYFLVQRIMAAPLALVGQSVAQVLTAELGRKLAANEAGSFQLFIRAVTWLALIGGVPIAFLGVFGRSALPALLGPEWAGAEDFLLIMTPFFVGQFVVSPLANFMNALGCQTGLLVWDTLRLIIVLPAIVVPASLGLDVEFALASFSLAMLFFYVILLVWLGAVLMARSRTA